MKTHVDLFSGIGGFALAAHWAGYQTKIFCERDGFCKKVLGMHWPNVPVISDIHDFDGREYAGVDLLTGGFPCQPYSCAGQQLGHEDDRALWPEMLRIIAEAHPDWVVAENVAGFIHMALDGVLSDLEKEGYEVGTVVLPACAVNAPHRRDRVWIMAHADRQGLEGRRGDELRKCTRQRTAGTEDSLSNPDRQPLGRLAEPRCQRSSGQFESRLGGMVDGLPALLDRHFDSEPAIPRVSARVPNRSSRLKVLGNAIVPQVAYEIIKRIPA